MQQRKDRKDVQRVVHGHLATERQKLNVQRRPDNHHERNAKEIKHEDHRLQRINRLLGAVQRRVIVWRRIVKQGIPVGQLPDATRVDPELPQRIGKENCQKARQQHLNASAGVQNQLAPAEPTLLGVQVDAEPVDDQRQNGHKPQIKPIVLAEVRLARSAHVVYVYPEAPGAGPTLAEGRILQQRPAAVKARTFVDGF